MRAIMKGLTDAEFERLYLRVAEVGFQANGSGCKLTASAAH